MKGIKTARPNRDVLSLLRSVLNFTDDAKEQRAVISYG